MALVAYSDSEGSETEDVPTPAPAPLKPASKISDKPAFQKLTKPSGGPRKIKVDLPSVQPEPSKQDEQPPAKRARTAGAFSGFNSLLPAPKQPAKAAPKAGVSLKTSSEAVFSRAPLTQSSDWTGDDKGNGDGVEGGEKGDVAVVKEEPKLVGKATKFKPLSVANKKKAVKKVKAVEEGHNGVDGLGVKGLMKEDPVANETVAGAPPPPKPKRSLFSMPAAEEPMVPDMADEDDYSQPDNRDSEASSAPQPQQPTQQPPTTSNPNSLQSVADSMNLTPAQCRQLFGRNSKNHDVSVANFSIDSEYASNEQLRQAGETVEHRAVKAIAPGKHSLQQLVNNARTQQEGLEDKWAAGRQARGEGGGKYGWGGRANAYQVLVEPILAFAERSVKSWHARRHHIPDWEGSYTGETGREDTTGVSTIINLLRKAAGWKFDIINPFGVWKLTHPYVDGEPQLGVLDPDSNEPLGVAVSIGEVKCREVGRVHEVMREENERLKEIDAGSKAMGESGIRCRVYVMRACLRLREGTLVGFWGWREVEEEVLRIREVSQEFKGKGVAVADSKVAEVGDSR